VSVFFVPGNLVVQRVSKRSESFAQHTHPMRYMSRLGLPGVVTTRGGLALFGKKYSTEAWGRCGFQRGGDERKKNKKNRRTEAV
jgi:hypothetical protein